MSIWLESIITKNEEIAPGIYKMIIQAKEIVNIALAGQFINVYCNSKVNLLPRPISICEINKADGTITLVYAVIGKGTALISQIKPEETLKIMGPLGNGFSTKAREPFEDSIIIGGGVGIPPLLELVKSIKGRKTAYLGFRSNPFLVDEFKKHCTEVYISTEDGSYGSKGNVIDQLNATSPLGEIIYSCGPKPMLKAVYNWSNNKNIPTQLSFEERMACGIGACLVCTCKTKKGRDKDWEHSRVCKDGPVYSGDEVIWDD